MGTLKGLRLWAQNLLKEEQRSLSSRRGGGGGKVNESPRGALGSASKVYEAKQVEREMSYPYSASRNTTLELNTSSQSVLKSKDGAMVSAACQSPKIPTEGGQ